VIVSEDQFCSQSIFVSGMMTHMKKTTYRQKINGKEKIKAFIFFSSQLID